MLVPGSCREVANNVIKQIRLDYISAVLPCSILEQESCRREIIMNDD